MDPSSWPEAVLPSVEPVEPPEPSRPVELAGTWAVEALTPVEDSGCSVDDEPVADASVAVPVAVEGWFLVVDGPSVPEEESSPAEAVDDDAAGGACQHCQLVSFGSIELPVTPSGRHSTSRNLLPRGTHASSLAP